MSNANGVKVKTVGQVGRTGEYPSMGTVQGTLQGASIRPVATRGGQVKYVHTLKLVAPTGTYLTCNVWDDGEIDLEPLVNTLVTLEVLRFQESNYGTKLDSEATVRYQLDCRFPAGVLD